MGLGIIHKITGCSLLKCTCSINSTNETWQIRLCLQISSLKPRPTTESPSTNKPRRVTVTTLTSNDINTAPSTEKNGHIEDTKEKSDKDSCMDMKASESSTKSTVRRLALTTLSWSL